MCESECARGHPKVVAQETAGGVKFSQDATVGLATYQALSKEIMAP